MFERFTAQARQAFHLAMAEARAGGGGQIDCQHMLIGLAHGRSGPAAEALSAAGLRPERLRELARRDDGGPAAEPLDADALALVGIDLDEVRRAAEAAFGPGALDRPQGRAARFGQRAGMTHDAKVALDLAVRAVRGAGDRWISPGHLLIGLIDQGDNAALRVLSAAGADPAALRADVLRRMTAAA
jgi:ATP-dependent Clp protease ATP-binding subunit ClpA